MVSFIIPVYKPDYDILKKCLKSLKTQSYKDWEGIVVIDGPDADAEAFIHSFSDTRLKVVVKPHGGAPAARNEGFKHVKGDIVCFWDCDCVIEPDTCKTWVDTFTTHPDIDFVYSGYKFMGENGGIVSEPFDPWLLKCANFISTCFPMRKKVFPGWDESLKSLQDWDMWLSVVECGGKGLFLPGFAFSTAMPDVNSISGRNCGSDVWLDRVKAVKDKHNIPIRKVCVASLEYKQEGVRLAKLIDADYSDMPGFKVNNYEIIIQVGFDLDPRKIMAHTKIFNQALKKKIIFWTLENIAVINNIISHRALREYSRVLNTQAIQFVEDMAAKKTMESAGFNVSVLPVPMVNTDAIDALPETKRILVDVSQGYRQLAVCLQHSLPDIPFDYIDADKPIKDYSAILSINSESSMSFPVKRMLLTGRHVISNIQNPFCGYVNESQDIGGYMSEMVDVIRKRIKRSPLPAIDFWSRQLSADKLMEVLK